MRDHEKNPSVPPGGRTLLSRLLLAALFACAVLAAAPRAATAACGTVPGDDAALASFVAGARAACPCDDGTRRADHRRCIRDRIAAAVRAGELPSSCRASAVRFASRSTCGAHASAVTCCAPPGRGTCRVARSAAACDASLGGNGRVGATESCYDACAAQTPTPTPVGPTPTATPSPTPDGIGPRCLCRCDAPPQPGPSDPYGCPSFHDCAVMTFVPSGSAECDALDTPHRGCFYTSNAPNFWPDGPLHDVCTF